MAPSSLAALRASILSASSLERSVFEVARRLGFVSVDSEVVTADAAVVVAGFDVGFKDTVVGRIEALGRSRPTRPLLARRDRDERLAEVGERPIAECFECSTAGSSITRIIVKTASIPARAGGLDPVAISRFGLRI